MRGRGRPIASRLLVVVFFFQAEDGIRDLTVTGVQTCALPILQRVWSASVDDKKAVALRLGLGLSVAGNRVYAAGHRGDIVAIDVSSGRILWRKIGRASCRERV